MAYTINLTNGAIFATIADGTINTSSSMTLVGKNYAGTIRTSYSTGLVSGSSEIGGRVKSSNVASSGVVTIPATGGWGSVGEAGAACCAHSR